MFICVWLWFESLLSGWCFVCALECVLLTSSEIVYALQMRAVCSKKCASYALLFQLNDHFSSLSSPSSLLLIAPYGLRSVRCICSSAIHPKSNICTKYECVRDPEMSSMSFSSHASIVIEFNTIGEMYFSYKCSLRYSYCHSLWQFCI